PLVLGDPGPVLGTSELCGLLRCGTADLVGLKTFQEDRPDVLAWVETAERVLEDHLEVLAFLAHRLRVQARQVAAIEPDLTVGDVVQTQDPPAQCGLATAGLTDQPVGLASFDP